MSHPTHHTAVATRHHQHAFVEVLDERRMMCASSITITDGEHLDRPLGSVQIVMSPTSPLVQLKWAGSEDRLGGAPSITQPRFRVIPMSESLASLKAIGPSQLKPSVIPRVMVGGPMAPPAVKASDDESAPLVDSRHVDLFNAAARSPIEFIRAMGQKIDLLKSRMTTLSTSRTEPAEPAQNPPAAGSVVETVLARFKSVLATSES